MERARTFWACVRACTLQTFSNFECNLRIAPSPFPILVTKLSDHPFHEKWSVHARFSLACSCARSKQFQTLGATLELVHLRFLFWWPISQITPLWETGRACTFWASVLACTLWTFSNSVCNLRICQSFFSSFLWPNSQITPYIRNGPCTHVSG